MSSTRHETNYVLITLAHNEEKNLPRLTGCILGQALRPEAWVIIDDSSTDRTSKIIDGLVSKHTWIYTKKIEGYENMNMRDFDLRWSKIVKGAFDFAEEICCKDNIQYEYIGQIDADMVLPPGYYERLIKEFQENPNLGYAGGRLVNAKLNDNGGIVKTRGLFAITDDWPISGCSLIRKQCLHQIGGSPLMQCADNCLIAKVKLGGWQTKVFTDIGSFHTRRRAVTKGRWRGYAAHGYCAYCVGVTPGFELMYFPLRILQLDIRFAFGYLYGYFSSLLKREEKIEDEEIKAYYRQRLWEIWKFILIRIKNLFSQHNFR